MVIFILVLALSLSNHVSSFGFLPGFPQAQKLPGEYLEDIEVKTAGKGNLAHEEFSK